MQNARTFKGKTMLRSENVSKQFSDCATKFAICLRCLDLFEGLFVHNFIEIIHK